MTAGNWWASIPGYQVGVKRSESEEARARVLMIEDRHSGMILERMTQELGPRAVEAGQIDLSSNLISRYIVRRDKAYSKPVLCTGLSPVLASAIGDASASVTIDRYAMVGGRPMPTAYQKVAYQALRYRIGANYVGMAVGWSKKSKRVFGLVITPDVLQVEYDSEDPIAPTRIYHYVNRTNGSNTIACRDEYDLSDSENPIYRVLSMSGADLTTQIFGRSMSGDLYTWRYDAGRPFHRIIVSGDPRQPYLGMGLVEGTLRAAVGRTEWWRGFRDASHPLRYTVNLYAPKGDSNSENRSEGIAMGPEMVLDLRIDNQGQPYNIGQWAPAHDSKTQWDALTAYEQDQLQAVGLPIRFEGTGGEPIESERIAIEEAIESTFSECRGQDVLFFRRAAAVCNREGEAAESRDEERPYPPIAEGGYGTLYRNEIHEALEEYEKEEMKKAEKAKVKAPIEKPATPTNEDEDADE